MDEQPYQGGISLRDLQGRQSAGIDIVGREQIVHLTVTVGSERGSAQVVVDFFDPDDLDDLILALRGAKDRARFHSTGAAA
jgi:hypothetical protein